MKRRFQSLPFKCNLQRYTVVGLYTLNPVDLQLQSARFQPLHLSSESLVSKFAFKCNLYRYTKEVERTARSGEMQPQNVVGL